MKPVLLIEGKSVAEGTPLTLGAQITLSTEFYSAHCHSSHFSKRDKILTAGGFYTIVSNFGKVSSRLVEKHLSNGNSYLPKLGGIIQSEIHSAKPNDILIIEDGVYIENNYNETTYTNCLGNYWDNYKGTNADGDGIGDSPYSVADDKDYYPFMERFEGYNILAPANVVIWDAHYDAGGNLVATTGW
jgi:hypothetical protein